MPKIKTKLKLDARNVIMDMLENAVDSIYYGYSGAGLTEPEMDALWEAAKIEIGRVAWFLGYEIPEYCKHKKEV